MKKIILLISIISFLIFPWGFANAKTGSSFVVMIDNHRDARPQYGIGEADIVYEAPVEGGITRFMAIFINKNLKKIGPVRSAREYFVKLAYPYKSLYIHCGGSPYAYIAIKKLGIFDLDQLAHEGYFKRDHKKKAPHNLFTSTYMLIRAAKKLHIHQIMKIPYFGAKISYLKNKKSLVGKIFIKYNKSYSISYKYEKNKNIYIRYVGDKLWKDALTGKPIMVNNIIVMFVPSKLRAKDSLGRLKMNVEGMGKGIVFTGGGVLSIRWVKHPKEPIFLMDKSGGRITLNPGKTWIQILPKNKKEIAYK